MLILPVLDLKGGRAVHAVRGQRAAYAPVRGVLAGDGDAVTLARAYRECLGCHACYVADLDAIAGAPPNDQLLRALIGLGTALWVDAGTTTVGAARALIDLGVARVIVGSESLHARAQLATLAAGVDPAQLVLSLDQQDGRLCAPADVVDADDLLRAARDVGMRDIILLDLARVGAGIGPPLALLADLRARFPDLALYAGGGVRDRRDLADLARLGAAGALVATAFHRGVLTAADLRAYLP